MLRLVLIICIVEFLKVTEGDAGLFDQYLVCRRSERLYRDQTSPRTLPGKPGRRGPPGPRGPPGFIANDLRQYAMDCRGVFYEGRCYWLPIVISNYSSPARAKSEKLCNFFGGSLVDITDAKMYGALYKYIQMAWMIYLDQPQYNFVDVWLASTYQNGRVTQNATSQSAYVRWYHEYPKTGNAIGWRVATRPSRSEPYIGMFTTSEANTFIVPFCGK